jgi:glycosyltransferase domain-containing protein
MLQTKNMVRWFLSELRSENSGKPSIDYPQLAKLSVVVPSFQRQDFLLRQFVYWKNALIHLIVVDGSIQSLDEAILDEARKYIRLSYFHTRIGISERLTLASSQIDTPYAILHGDDEFMLKTGLCSAINRLEEKQDFVACIGQSRSFHVDGENRVVFGPGYPHPNYEIAHCTVKERIQAAMTNYNAATCYAVLRSDAWRRTFGGLGTWASAYTGEMQQALSLYILGKLTSTEEIYWMRSSENQPVSGRDFDRTLSFETWWTTKRYTLEKQTFVKLLASQIQSTEGIDYSQAVQSVEFAMNSFIESQRTQREKQLLRSRSWSLIRSYVGRFLRIILPVGIFVRLKKAIDQSRNCWLAIARKWHGEVGMRSNDHSFTEDSTIIDVSEMEKIVFNFYKAKKG